MNCGQKLFIITRGWSLPISISSVTIGTLLALEKTDVSIGLYLMVLVGIASLHAAANTFNDYFDLKNKIDTPQSPTARYRPHGVFQGLITPKALFWLSAGLLAVAFVIGITLAIKRTWLLLPIIFAGASIAIFYTALPKKGLKYIALGEPAVFLAFGPLLIEGSYAVQTLTFSLTAFWISIPIGILVALIVFANNLRDRHDDCQNGIKTLATLLSPEAGRRLFVILAYLPYLIVILYTAGGILGWPLMVTWIALPKTRRIIRHIADDSPDAADAKTSQILLSFNILFILGFIIDLLRHYT